MISALEDETEKRFSPKLMAIKQKVVEKPVKPNNDGESRKMERGLSGKFSGIQDLLERKTNKKGKIDSTL